mmetsp:Transcript_40145/g.113691  ORF Transcript_40145/g.113691 Transcript_40145/m.113691 type:complete len:215 (-) Transcript_40145:274-918(-)
MWRSTQHLCIYSPAQPGGKYCCSSTCYTSHRARAFAPHDRLHCLPASLMMVSTCPRAFALACRVSSNSVLGSPCPMSSIFFTDASNCLSCSLIFSMTDSISLQKSARVQVEPRSNSSSIAFRSCSSSAVFPSSIAAHSSISLMAPGICIAVKISVRRSQTLVRLAIVFVSSLTCLALSSMESPASSTPSVSSPRSTTCWIFPSTSSQDWEATSW